MTTWHAPPDVLERFARAPQALDDATASSLEQHLLTCADCRALVAHDTDPAALQRSWAQIADVIDRPRAPIGERLLGRLGMPAGMARVVGATPGLRLAWLTTATLVAGAAVLAAHDASSDTAFLVLAPILPLGAVLLTFLATEDPAGEAGTATPMHGAGLLLRRAVTVVVPTFLILAAASLAQPDLGRGALWVLPSLALTLGALVLTTFVRPTVATVGLSLVWLSAVVLGATADGYTAASVTDTAVFGPAGQLLSLLLAIVAATLLYVRRDRFSTLEVLL